jgi:ATP-binding cassette subfamily B protein
LAFLFVQAAFCWVLVHRLQANVGTIGDIQLVLHLSYNILDSFWEISKDFSDFNEYLGRLTQGLEVINNIPESFEDINENYKIIQPPTISFENVTFYYNSLDPIFINSSISIPAKQKIGIIGYSGSGKTTFVNLILRIAHPRHGKILFDNQDISTFDNSTLYANICVVPQEPMLMYRSILDNIAYAKLSSTLEEVKEAAKKACIHDNIMNLSEGYNTLLSENILSGGQRQRILIARAMLKNAPILILDEATSALDNVTERQLQQNFLSFMKDKTTIVISHKLQHLSYLDRIIVLDKGRIVQDGSHEELLEENGIYKNLWNV